MILVNNQLDAQFFMNVYFYSLHPSGSHVPIIMRIIVLMRHLVCVTLCRWPSGMQVNLRAAMCQSSGELLYQRDTWFMSLCVDGRLACRLTFGQPCANHQENYCINVTPGLCHSVWMIIWYAS